MDLQMIYNQAISLTLERREKTPADVPDDRPVFDFNYSTVYSEDDPKVFCVVFDIRMLQPEGFEMECRYSTWFETNEDITEEFRRSDFPHINAPAIAFPFLRAFIGNLTLGAGYRPTVLPSVNFISLYREKQRKEKAKTT